MASPPSSSSSPRKPASPLRFASLALLTSLMVLSLLAGGAYFSQNFPCETRFLLSSTLCSGSGSRPGLVPQGWQVHRPPPRPYTDKELAALAFSQDVLRQPRSHLQHTKIAFMFLTRHELPHERLWEHFFQVRGP